MDTGRVVRVRPGLREVRDTEVKTRARRPYAPHVWETMAIKYNVPLKNGRTIETIALSPYVDTCVHTERHNIRDGMMRAMNKTAVDVVRQLKHPSQVTDALTESTAKDFGVVGSALFQTRRTVSQVPSIPSSGFAANWQSDQIS